MRLPGGAVLMALHLPLRACSYLLFKSSREELLEDVEALKKRIGGDN